MAEPDRPSDPPSLPGARPSPPGDRLAEFLARTRPSPGAAAGAGPCPDPGLLAGWAEGRLLPREVEALEAHLAPCGECRSAVAALILDAAVPAVRAPASAPAPAGLVRALRPWRFAIPAAAAVLVAFLLLEGRPRQDSPEETGTALVAAARDLAAARPELFGGFRPLDRGELLAPGLLPKRGGALALLRPSGRILEVRPGLRWERVPGVERWTVSLLSADGGLLWSEGSARASLAWPAGAGPLRPGTRYLWEVKGEGPLGPERSRRSFAVATEEERRVFEAGALEIDARAPAALRPLLRAHLALRAGLTAEAEAPARQAFAAAPGEPVARETLVRVLDELGEPEAADAIRGPAPDGPAPGGEEPR